MCGLMVLKCALKNVKSLCTRSRILNEIRLYVDLPLRLSAECRIVDLIYAYISALSIITQNDAVFLLLLFFFTEKITENQCSLRLRNEMR